MTLEMIKGTNDYYQLTSKEFNETGSVSQTTIDQFLDIVGIQVIDETTVEYTMVSPNPYFNTLTTYSTLYPISQAALDEYGTDHKTIYFNGSYLCSKYEQGSYKKLVQNPTWWNKVDTRFETVTIQMVEDQAMSWLLIQSGDIYNVTLGEDTLLEIYKQGDSSEWYQYLVEGAKRKYVAVLHFNYNQKLDDGSMNTQWNTAVANKNFRLMFYYGVD